MYEPYDSFLRLPRRVPAFFGVLTAFFAVAGFLPMFKVWGD